MCSVGVKEQNLSSVLAFGNSLGLEREFLYSSPVWGARLWVHVCKAQPHAWCRTETCQGAPKAMGSGSLPAAFPHHQHEWCHAGIVIFVLVTVCCFIGTSLVILRAKPLNWNIPWAVGKITSAFLLRCRIEPYLSPCWQQAVIKSVHHHIERFWQ